MLKKIKKEEIPSRGRSYAKVSYGLIIDKEGHLIDIYDLREPDRKNKLRAVQLLVPEQPKRSGKNAGAYFLCDNGKYVFGAIEKDSFDRKCFERFCEIQEAILENNHPIMLFLKKWKPEKTFEHPVIQRHGERLNLKDNFVFFSEEHGVYFHENEELIKKHLAFRESQVKGKEMNCLVTGEYGPVSRIHTAIKGVMGAQPAGAAIVGFNDEAFCSYGKGQSYNAPVGEEAMFKYTTALNYMLANEKYHIYLKHQTVVFWANQSEKAQFLTLFGIEGEYVKDSEDKNKKDKGAEGLTESNEKIDLARALFQKAKQGLKPNYENYNLNADENLYVLALSPNNARLFVSFWWVNTLDVLVESIAAHYRDITIDGGQDFWPMKMILSETVSKKAKKKTVLPMLEKGLLQSIFNPHVSYASALYEEILNRIKADRIVNALRAGVLKGYINRKRRLEKSEKEGIPVGLDENRKEQAYHMGRLFAVLEKAQKEAIPGIIRSIKETYFTSAMSVPSHVFPKLMELSVHHVKKIKYGTYYEKKKSEIIDKISTFPQKMTTEQKGEFVIGYYHQNKFEYTKKEKNSEGESDENKNDN